MCEGRDNKGWKLNESTWEQHIFGLINSILTFHVLTYLQSSRASLLLFPSAPFLPFPSLLSLSLSSFSANLIQSLFVREYRIPIKLVVLFVKVDKQSYISSFVRIYSVLSTKFCYKPNPTKPDMEKNNNRKKVGGSSSSSSPTNFDHLFGPKDPSSTSSSSSSLFSSIFPPPSTVGGRDSRKQDNGGRGYGPAGNYGKGESSGGISNKNTSTNYENETVEASYYSSSIYYGGQENYSPRTRTTESHHPHVFKKDKDNDDDDPNGNDSNSASRGNWWQGSLYY